MSKVDLQVIKDFQAAMDSCSSLNYFVKELCSGGLYVSTDDKSIVEDFGYEHKDSESEYDEGSEWCSGVFKLKDKFYSSHWYYTSYDGTDVASILDNLVEVKPKEVIVTKYESI